MNTKKLLLTAALVAALGLGASAQSVLGGGQVSGNIQIDGQMSRADSNIGAQDVPERLLMNARADILYTNGNFSAGLRFEAYQNPLLGFKPEYKNVGVPNYFVAYNGEQLSVTAGHYYEQFGNGMILRAYEDRYLGLDNALQGFSVKYRPVAGVTIKALVGRQRDYWDFGSGLVRGVDAEVNLNSVVKALEESKTRVTLGAGFVSKYEENEAIAAAPGYELTLPLNVGAGAVRLDLSHGGWGLQAEYARKGQDPNIINNFIYHQGEALFLSASYSQKGFSANVQAKRVDNMVFKSERQATGERLYINYIPAINKQHTYAFLTLFPYATQTEGEMGLTADVIYKIKKNTLLGGKYGTELHFNAAAINAIAKDEIFGGLGTDGYSSPFLGTGDPYYMDATMEVAKKLSKDHRVVFTYGYMMFDPVVEGHGGSPVVHSHVLIGDWTWKVNKKNVLRFEAEWLKSDVGYEASHDRRNGDWAMALVEWNFRSNFFLAFSDQYCYANGYNTADAEALAEGRYIGTNYPQLSFGYTHGSTRMQLAYGKQREGMLCIGGVCRTVPASNGLTFSLTTSF